MELHPKITGFYDYEVTLDGNVINTKTGKMCKINKYGKVILINEMGRCYRDIFYIRLDFVKYNTSALYESGIKKYLNGEELSAMEKEVGLTKWVIRNLTKDEIQSLNFDYGGMNKFYYELTYGHDTYEEEKKKKLLAKYIPENKTYLSELRNELPTNCLFDKGKVGCGGTTLAIESNRPYVICVPFTSLVDNKIAQYPNERYSGKLFGVQKGVTVSQIKDYAANTAIPKIITTYDGLSKVVEAIDTCEYYLLVDEYHILFTQYSFRSEAIKTVLSQFRNFKEFCFMTATPIEDEFILDELKDVPVVRQEWKNVVTASILTVQCDSVLASTMMLIREFLNENEEGNAYFFLNSTKVIKDIVKKLGLTSDNTRVIYSKYSKVQMGIPNGSTLDKPKKINFLTSTAFEGSDIYDEDGKIFIVSDSNAQHSLLDISTSVQQIAGRIRNSKFKSEIVHLYSLNRYINLSYEEFKASQEQEAERCVQVKKELNELSEEARSRIEISGSTLYLIKNEDNFIEFDPNLVKVDTFNYKVATSYTIRINLEDIYKDNNFNIEGICADHTRLKDISVAKDTITFKEVVKEIEGAFIKDWVMGFYLDKYPFLEEAIKKIGFDGMKELKYNQKAIQSALLNLLDCPIEHKVIKALKLNVGQFISSKEIKSKLAEVYKNLDLKISAKATDIAKYYDVKEGMRTIDDRRCKGFYILRPLSRVLD